MAELLAPLAGPALGLAATSLFVLLAALLGLVFNLQHLPRPPREDEVDPGRLPTLGVVLPVRDEEDDVEGCVRSILAQDYPALELVVVDDGSTDRTPEILAGLAAEDPRLRVHRNDELPAGWMGKNHALHVGAGDVATEWILFVDVDVRLLPAALTRAVACAEARGADLLTLVPELVSETFWERVIMPFIVHLILLVFPARDLNDPTKKAASGNGPFMLFRRSAYDAIGGHAAIPGEVVEDLVLAQRIKEQGHRLAYVQGVELAKLRMYTTLGEIWQGWSKNFHVAVGGHLVVAAIGAAALVALFALPWVLPVLALFGLSWPLASSPWFGVLVLGLAYVLVAITLRLLLEAELRLDDSLVWLQPVAAVVTAGILLNSTWRASRGKGVSWKGRTYGTAGEGEV